MKESLEKQKDISEDIDVMKDKMREIILAYGLEISEDEKKKFDEWQKYFEDKFGLKITTQRNVV